MALRSKTFIRRAEREDLDTVVAWMEDSDFQLFLYGDPARSPKQIREQIVSMLGRSSAQTVPGGLYLIIDSAAHGPLGLLSLQNISWRNRNCSIDLYMGRKEMRHKLVAGISFYRAMQYVFEELNLHRVNAYIYSFNEASWRILERMGGVRELTLPEHVARDGKLYDLYGYGLLRHEFEAFKEKNPHMVEDLVESMTGSNSGADKTTEKAAETDS
ncbi:MAG: GNAT family protein [Candidatus Hydrogenedentes bacterium]|nr:GNAT family protein [Candidatus Hydrogenedentota bacterium]